MQPPAFSVRGLSFRILLVMPQTGRNDECPCGSKQKYKHCCLKLEQERPERNEWLQHPHTLQDKNLTLLDAAIDIFGLKRLRRHCVRRHTRSIR